MMLDTGLAKGTAYAAYATQEPKYAANTTQEIVIRPTSAIGEYALASETSLISIWMTPEENEAWKNL
jgi:hypothetical protein